MRFKTNGPSIPDILLEERDAGNVVFLCGAGVSIPAGLPSFVDLTRHVIDEVDPAQDSGIRRAFDPWIDNDWTRVGALRPGLDQVFQLLNQEYGRDRIAKIVWEELAKVEAKDAREHEIASRISANAEGHPQIVTTNFDRLFESALGERATPIHQPPITTVPVESRGGAYPVGIGGSSGAFATGPQSDSREHVSSPRSPNPAGRSPAPGSPVESCDSHTGSRARPADGSRERWHHARTLALAGRCVVRPVDALATATMQVVPFACACDDCEHNRAAARPVLTLPTTDFVSWD